MSTLDKFERQLNVWLTKKAPIAVPSNGRTVLSNALWWIALVAGILQLWAATAFWHTGHLVNQVINFTSGVPTTVNAMPATKDLGLFYWLSLWTLSIDALLLLIASPSLKRMKKEGWKLLYYSVLLNALYDILRIFSNVGANVAGFISTAIGTVIAAYFLFQVRSHFIHDHDEVHHRKVTAGHSHESAVK